MKKKLLIGIPLMLIVPAIIIWSISTILHFVVPYNPQTQTLLFDFSCGITIADYLSIYVTIISAEVTATLGFIIFRLGEKKEQTEENEKKKIARKVLIEDANYYWKKIGKYVWDYYVKNNNAVLSETSKLDKPLFEIDESWHERLLLIKPEITDDCYNVINEYFRDVKLLLVDKDILTFLKKYTLSFWPNNLARREIKRIKSLEDVKSYKLEKYLTELSGNLQMSNRTVAYDNGNIFYEEMENGIKYRIYDINKEKIFDYDFEENSGFKTEYCEDEIKRQGAFYENVQISGYTYGAICNIDGEYLKENYSSQFIETEDEYDPENKNQVLVADFEIQDKKYTRISEKKCLERTYL